MEKSEKKLVLRMDDVGASSKQYEVYSKKWKGIGNFLFLKFLPYFKAWGPYRELTASEWDQIFHILRRYQAKMTVGITASWVEFNGTLTPFPQKFPEEARKLKEGIDEGLIEIGIHGLTHCVVENLAFRPKLFRGNRKCHREFRPELGRQIHFENLKKAKEILEDYFQIKMQLLIPPGNLFSNETIKAAHKLGISTLNCDLKSTGIFHSNELKLIGNENILAFHDKEIVEEGISWLENLILQNKKNEPNLTFVHIKDL